MQGRKAAWVDDGTWEHLVLREPRRVVCRRPSTARIPPRRKSNIPPRVRRPSTIPPRVRRVPRPDAVAA